MGPSSSRYTTNALGSCDQAAVDAYKARSVWGAWWKLSEVLRCRFFSDQQRRFVRRYGARLDALASLAEAPRTAAEEHFVKVCNGELSPTSEKERLWLLVQIVCRYEDAADRAARVSIAEHRAAALEAEVNGLRVAQREDELYIMELVHDLQMATSEKAPSRQHQSIANVEHATLRFRRRDGSPPIRSVVADPTRRWSPLVLPGSRSAIAQGPLLP